MNRYYVGMEEKESVWTKTRTDGIKSFAMIEMG